MLLRPLRILVCLVCHELQVLLLCLQPLRFLQPLQPGLLLLPFLLLLLLLLGFSGGSGGGSNPCVGLLLDLGLLARCFSGREPWGQYLPGLLRSLLGQDLLGRGSAAGGLALFLLLLRKRPKPAPNVEDLRVHELAVAQLIQ